MSYARQGLVLLLLCLPTSGWAFGSKEAAPPVSPLVADSFFHRTRAGVSARDLGAYTTQVLTEQWLQPATQARMKAEAENIFFDPPLDAGVLFQLNLDAGLTWQAMVDCQGRGVADQAEAARDAYYMGGRLCADDATNEATRAQVRALSQRFQDFLVTSSFEGIYQMRLKLKYPLIHPLLAEFATEFVYATWHHVQQHYQVRGQNYYHADEMTVRGDLDRCRYDSERMKSLCTKDGERVPLYWNRLYFNSLKLLSSLHEPTRGCAHYGLWPNATLVASASLSVFSGRAYVDGARAGTGHLPDDFLMSSAPIRALPDARMPSCWNSDTGALLALFAQPRLDPNRYDGSKFDATLKFMAMVTPYVEEYYRLYLAWSR